MNEKQIQTVRDLIGRITPGLTDSFIITGIDAADGHDTWKIAPAENGKVSLCGSGPLAASAAYGYYLKYYLNANISWCGTRIVIPDELPEPKETVRIIDQKYRVYMNYCTHSYSAAWWDWERWEREIDMMALNGINMPLAITGTEAVWYKTLTDLGFTDDEARGFLCGPAFFAWQWMTNIEGYGGPLPKSWIESHEILGKQILARELEFGMFPIQQGFSGFAPMLLKEKFPESRILVKKKWNNIGATAEIDPTDPLFEKVGMLFMKNQHDIFGTYGFYAADPFHEGHPPVDGEEYLAEVGRTISSLFEKYDENYTWVMQAWSLRESIVKAVPKDHLLILDLNGGVPEGEKYWGYSFVSGILHNFGARMSSLHGDIRLQASNKYMRTKKVSPNIVGNGLFMEGIGQNPLFYDLALEMLTRDDTEDVYSWLDGYCLRRYGTVNDKLKEALRLLADHVYVPNTDFTERGSMICTRPALSVFGTGPCDSFHIHYDPKILPQILNLLEQGGTRSTEGLEYDRMDICRQMMSNYAQKLYFEIRQAYYDKDIDVFETKKAEYLTLLDDFDALLAFRPEWRLQTWIKNARKQGTNDEERRLYEYNARSLVTIWGNEEFSFLFDYAWKEWSGLTGTYYLGRWKIFLDMLSGKLRDGIDYRDDDLEIFENRIIWRASPFYSDLADWENAWLNSTEEIPIRNTRPEFVYEMVRKYSPRV